MDDWLQNLLVLHTSTNCNKVASAFRKTNESNVALEVHVNPLLNLNVFSTKGSIPHLPQIEQELFI